jgi:DNA-binding NarL/FixJ family response regulator
LKRPVIRVLVVDDFDPWHDFISKTLQNDPGLKVIANAYNGAEGVHQAQKLQPDLILLDIGLPTLNGIEAARRIHEFAPKSKILFTTENRSWDIAQVALSTGANGYLVKSSAGSELLPAIDAVLRGKQFVSACLKDHNSTYDPDLAQRERVVAHSPLESVDCHDLRLYPDDGAFVEGFAQSIEAALGHGDASIVLATEAHCSDLLQKLRADGVNVAAAVERSLLVLLDVADSLSTFTAEGATGHKRTAGSARIPELIQEAVQTAKEKHLHVAVG